MDEDAEREEEAANLQCEIIDAARTLIEDHGYSKEDVLAILKAVC